MREKGETRRSAAQGSIPMLVLAGPTAAGKTALALSIAERLGTEIISADSAQVYRFLDIGTAKPSREEKARVRHHLIDIVDPDEEYSAASYQRDAEAVISRFLAAGRLPFLVGGTGLYLRAVTMGYAFGRQGKDRRLREQLAGEASAKGLDFLYRRLKELDPVGAASIHPNDQKRIIRALEVLTLEGRPIAEQVARTKNASLPYRAIQFCLSWERVRLYERIEKRVDQMFASGLVEETRTLLEKGFSLEAAGLKVIGYRQAAQHLAGKLSLNEAVEEVKKHTRNLAKRQLTWFRGENEMRWLMGEEGYESGRLAEIICAAVKELPPRQENNSL